MSPFRKFPTPDGRWGIVDAHDVQVALLASEWMADAIVVSAGVQPSRDQRLLENVAAISAEFHLDTEGYRAFYDSNANGLGGFPGIWRLMTDAGIAFTKAEPADWEGGEATRDYLDAIMLFAERLKSNTVPVDHDSLYRLAQECIHGQRGRISA
jgi:hypothetical protein